MTRLVTQGDAKRDSRLLREFCASGISVGCANTVLNPVEVVKTRMQLMGAPSAAAAAASAVTSRSMSAPAAAAGTPAQPSVGPAASASRLAAARYMSHSSSAVQSSASQVLDATSAASTSYRPWMFPQPPPPAASASAAATAAAARDEALAATLRSITAASSSSSSMEAAAAPVVRRPGFLATAGIIHRQEGLSGFTRGVQASAARAVFNGGIRLGLYDPIKGLLSADGSGGDLHVGQKLLAGSVSGGIGAVLTTPMELVKTRLQAPSATTRSVSEVVRSVVAAQGVLGLWRGATPSVLRLILLNSSMVATYDEVKGRIRAVTGWGGLPLVLASSMVAGVVTTTVINPTDVVRAYMQTGRGTAPLNVARGILAREGVRGFMKGWTAAYCRTGPQTLIIFSVSEVVRPLFGLKVIGSQ